MHFISFVFILEMSTQSIDLQLVNKCPKLVTSEVSKFDKFNDIKDWQPQNIFAIEIKEFEVKNPNKFNDLNE